MCFYWMMPIKKHHIKLGSDERDHLKKLANRQKAAAVKVQRAKAMLGMDCGKDGPGLSDAKVSVQCGLSIRSLERLRRRVCEIGPLGALERQPRLTPPVPPKVTGEVQAHMTKIACSEAPADCSGWTMQLIADRLVEMEIVESISAETVRTTLKKMTSNPGNKSVGASPRKKTPPL
jgi:hypothetical protein